MFLQPAVVQRVSHTLILAHPPIPFPAPRRHVYRGGIRPRPTGTVPGSPLHRQAEKPPPVASRTSEGASSLPCATGGRPSPAAAGCEGRVGRPRPTGLPSAGSAKEGTVPGSPLQPQGEKPPPVASRTSEGASSLPCTTGGRPSPAAAGREGRVGRPRPTGTVPGSPPAHGPVRSTSSRAKRRGPMMLRSSVSEPAVSTSSPGSGGTHPDKVFETRTR